MKHTPESQRCCLFEARNGTHLDCPKFQWLKTDSKRVMSLKLLVNSLTTEHIVVHPEHGLHVYKHNTGSAFLRRTVSRSHGSKFWPGSIKETSNRQLRFWLKCVIWLLTGYIHNELQWFEVPDQSEKECCSGKFGLPESRIHLRQYELHWRFREDTHLIELQYVSIRNKREEENIRWS